jgi:hypothetical protein
MVTKKFSFPILTHPGGNSTSGDRGNGGQPLDIIENNAESAGLNGLFCGDYSINKGFAGY